jgi:hypothetical protein
VIIPVDESKLSEPPGREHGILEACSATFEGPELNDARLERNARSVDFGAAHRH